jgi:hypothetical protein
MMLSSSGVISASNFYISEAGNLTASNANFQGIISSSEGNIGGFTINSTQINDEGNNLILKSNGQITASNAQISGSIVADNLTINNDILLGHNLDVAAGGSITNDNVTIDDSGIQINSGSITLGSNFHVDLLGNLTASNAQFSGSIVAQSGELQTLGVSGVLTIGAGGSITNGNVIINQYAITMNSGSIDLNSQFIATSDGQMTASNAIINGDIYASNITADSGSISG